MNTLKPLLIFAVLIGVCYGVYSRINHKNDSGPPEADGRLGNDSNRPLSWATLPADRRHWPCPARWATAGMDAAPWRGCRPQALPS